MAGQDKGTYDNMPVKNDLCTSIFVFVQQRQAYLTSLLSCAILFRAAKDAAS